jgi:hypothetical protein
VQELHPSTKCERSGASGESASVAK